MKIVLIINYSILIQNLHRNTLHATLTAMSALSIGNNTDYK